MRHDGSWIFCCFLAWYELMVLFSGVLFASCFFAWIVSELLITQPLVFFFETPVGFLCICKDLWILDPLLFACWMDAFVKDFSCLPDVLKPLETGHLPIPQTFVDHIHRLNEDQSNSTDCFFV